MSHTDDVKGRLDFAILVAREAGDITLRYFRQDDLAVDRKADDSPVTRADREAEQHLRARIVEAFPQDGILGEEYAEQPGVSGYRWILDPIDGTKSFIHGVPLYGTLIGVERAGESVLGVVHVAPLAETVYAAAGNGAWYVQGDRPPRPAQVSQRAPLSQGLFLTSEVGNFDRVGRRDAYEALQQSARLSRSWGDCYGYLMVVTGRAEVMVDPIVAVWDLAALKPIVEEAGGTFADWQGRRSITSGNSVATNGRIDDEVLAILRGHNCPPT